MWDSGTRLFFWSPHVQRPAHDEYNCGLCVISLQISSGAQDPGTPNEALWAPIFALPMIKTVLGAIGSDTWGADLDLGEMFLNFTLHNSLHAFCGVDLTPYFPDNVQAGCQTLWEWLMDQMFDGPEDLTLPDDTHLPPSRRGNPMQLP
jgi:hypothetical protein